MHPYENFLERAKQLLKPGEEKARYFLLFIDIENFHSFFHFYGVREGKVLLAETEETLAGLPGVILCSRIYAECYLCLCREEERRDGAIPIGATGKELGGVFREYGKRYPDTRLKLGCGICEILRADVEGAVEGAWLAHREAKRLGAQQPVFFSEQLRKQSGEIFETEKDSNRALREGRFCFYLQPQINLITGRIVGAEALMRGIDEDGKPVSPELFLSVMERTGAIIELDVMICRKVCAFLAQRREKGLPVVKTSVNLSGIHVQNPGSADLLHAAAMEYRIPPELLEFEISEKSLQSDFKDVKRFIDHLRGFGYRVSIDNFGSGYAGINIWQELNFDAVKLDRKFLSEEPGLKERNEALVPNIINIADRIRIDVLCEGVETAAQCGYLMSLGCTAGQGYCFASPVPPEDFYSSYEQLDGKFDTASWKSGVLSAGPEAGNKKRGKFRLTFDRAVRSYIAIGLTCALFLAVCIAFVFSFYRSSTSDEFTMMAVENLNTFANGQKENTIAHFDSVMETLDALAVMIAQKNDSQFTDGYLLALNKENPEMKFLYTTAEYFEENIKKGITPEEDIEIIQRLEKHENIISNITWSERLGDIYCIAIGVPVFQDGEFAGALRCIINAEMLVDADLFPASQGQVMYSFVVDSSGRILPVRGDGSDRKVSLIEQLRADGLEEDAIRRIKETLASDGIETDSVYAGKIEGVPVYISVTDLEYNDWHLVFAIRADMTVSHSRSIISSTLQGAAILILCTLFTCGVYFILVAKLLKRVSAGEERYQLIEQFSDTVLFDYDFKEDIIHFTPNASSLFRVGELVQEHALLETVEGNVYAGDSEVMRRMLRGQLPEKNGEVRVRLKHPAEDRYFWVLIQFRYVRYHGQLSSVVGKITDIDRQKSHEDMLQKISETDGLTGLRNKTATETAVADGLSDGRPGMLFMLDLDNFKQINDVYGHAAGDLALKYVAECMRKTFRSEDVLGRIGGDEMIVYTGNINDVNLAKQKAEQLMRMIRTGTKEGLPPLSVSIGISRSPQDGTTYGQLYRAADDAMYKAKSEGKGEYCFFDSKR